MIVEEETFNPAPLDGALPPSLPQSWPPSLRGAVEISVASPVGMLVLAGPDLLCVGNDAAAALLGDEAAGGAGAPLLRRWPQTIALAQVASQVLASAVADSVDAPVLALTAGGIPQQRDVTFACSPLSVAIGGGAAGVLVVLIEHGASRAALAEAAPSTPPPHHALTARERDILKLIGAGLQLKQVAGALAISVSSVNTYRNRIFRKMGLASNAAVIRYALKNGLVN